MRIETTSRESLAVLCIKHKLYTMPGTLKAMFKLIRACPNLGRLAVCFDGEKPIGVIVVTRWHQSTPSKRLWVMIFVRPEYRRRNIGTDLFNHMVNKYRYNKKNLEFAKGGRGSVKFFSRFDINRNDYAT